MKTIVFPFFFALLASLQLSAQEQSERTLVKSINPAGNQGVVFNFPHEALAATPWGEAHIRVELEVQANAPMYVLEGLAKANRYKLESYSKNDTLFLQAPNLEKRVTVGGEDLVETIRVHVSAPGYFKVREGVLVKEFNADMLARMEDMGSRQAEEMKRNYRLIKEDKLDLEIRFVSNYEEETKEELQDPASFASKKKTKSKKAKRSALSSLKPANSSYVEVLIDNEPLHME